MKQVQTGDARVREHTGLFYGWWIVIIGCIQDAVKGGTFNTGFTLYFLPILTELHLSRAATVLTILPGQTRVRPGRSSRWVSHRSV